MKGEGQELAFCSSNELNLRELEGFQNYGFAWKTSNSQGLIGVLKPLRDVTRLRPFLRAVR
jgi:hypothetical protein